MRALLSSFRLLFAASLGVTCLLAGTGSAEACWDGYSASVGRVAIAQAGSGEWSRDEAVALAEWMTKTDAMLPPHIEVVSEHGHIELRQDGLAEPIAEGTWSGRDVRELFKKTGELLGARRVVDARRASTMPVGRPYTVQLLAVKSRPSAERFATATNARTEPLDVPGTFYSAGGYPAIHPAAHVLDTDPRDGYTRVVAGAFLDERSARAAAADLAKHGVAAFARPL